MVSIASNKHKMNRMEIQINQVPNFRKQDQMSVKTRSTRCNGGQNSPIRLEVEENNLAANSFY